MYPLEPMGMEDVLPAVVIGFELEMQTGFELHTQVAPPVPAGPLPPWLVLVEQQAGGLNMCYPRVFGSVLPLPANLERGHGDTAAVMRAFAAMAEDPEMRILERDFPALADLVLTHGGLYPPAALEILSQFVSRSFDVPRFDRGIEAYLRCIEAEPLARFAGWRMLSVVPPTDEDPEKRYVDDHRLDAAALATLAAAARGMGMPGTPRIYFLWTNSD